MYDTDHLKSHGPIVPVGVRGQGRPNTAVQAVQQVHAAATAAAVPVIREGKGREGGSGKIRSESRALCNKERPEPIATKSSYHPFPSTVVPNGS